MAKNIIIFILSVVYLTSCNFSKGIKTDLTTGLTYSYNGFKLEDITVLDSHQKALTSNQLPEGSVLYFQMSNVGNYTVVDGKVYLGCSMKITDSNNSILYSDDDLYKNAEEFDVNKARNPIVSARLASPLTAGNTYTVEIHFYDKKKSENVIDASVKIELTPSKVNIQHTEKGLSFEDIWFAEEKGKLSESKVKYGSTAAIVLKGLKGFAEQEGKIYPGCQLVVKDKEGKDMLKYNDLFKDHGGIDPKTVYDSFYSTITFANPITADGSYDVSMYIFDKLNEDNHIQINMTVEVIK